MSTGQSTRLRVAYDNADKWENDALDFSESDRVPDLLVAITFALLAISQRLEILAGEP